MKQACITVKNMTMAYGDFIIQKNLNFKINQGDIFIVMGGSGCGKSTLMMHLIGMIKPSKGNIFYGNEGLWGANVSNQRLLLNKTGVLFQSGALLSSMTVGENVALPISENTQLNNKNIQEIVEYKLALVGLAGFSDYYPSEISGGMQKRAGLARAMALDPEILFFDEPSAGLDPISSKLLDELILSLRDNLNATIVMVTHELASIFSIGDNSVFLDPESKTMIAEGDPNILLKTSKDTRVIDFLSRKKK